MEALIAVCMVLVGMGLSLAVGLLLMVLAGLAGRALLYRVEQAAERRQAADPLPRMRSAGAL